MKWPRFKFGKDKQNEAKERAPVDLVGLRQTTLAARLNAAALQTLRLRRLKQCIASIRIQSFRSAASNGLKTKALHALSGLTQCRGLRTRIFTIPSIMNPQKKMLQATG